MHTGQHIRVTGGPQRTIRYVRREEIDAAQWDHCIRVSANSLIYASLSYLDTMAAHWDALILEDYEAVMPLCWNKKWGIRYLYHPALTPQLGVFSPWTISLETVTAFIDEARKHFRFAEIFLNFQNTCPGLQPFTNIVLDLAPSYEALLDRYKPDLIRNLKQSANYPLEFSWDHNVDDAINLYRQYYAPRTPHVGPTDYKRFAAYCQKAIRQDGVIIRTVRLQNGPPLALALLLRSEHRLYLLMSVCSPEGRKKSANHFLLDNLIREFAGTSYLLDFDGSEIPGIAHFYKNFGGTDQPYYYLRWNNLPWPLRFFKPDRTTDNSTSGK